MVSFVLFSSFVIRTCLMRLVQFLMMYRMKLEAEYSILSPNRFGKTSLRSVRTATVYGQYFPLRPLRSVSKKILSSDFRLVDHVIESLITDEFDCGLRCVRNKKCQSYNCYSDELNGYKKCELNDQTRRSKPTDFRVTKGFIYYGKGREITTAVHQIFKLIRLRQKS